VLLPARPTACARPFPGSELQAQASLACHAEMGQETESAQIVFTLPWSRENPDLENGRLVVSFTR